MILLMYLATTTATFEFNVPDSTDTGAIQHPDPVFQVRMKRSAYACRAIESVFEANIKYHFRISCHSILDATLLLYPPIARYTKKLLS